MHEIDLTPSSSPSWTTARDRLRAGTRCGAAATAAPGPARAGSPTDANR